MYIELVDKIIKIPPTKKYLVVGEDNPQEFIFKIPNIYDNDGNLLEAANHPEQIIKFKLDKQVYPNDIMRIKIN